MLSPDHIKFVSPKGSDTDPQHNGSTWETAKRTILAAYDSLPDSGGTIFISNGSHVGGEIEGQGIWLTGNSALLPGWRKAKRVSFIGVGGTATQFGMPAAGIIAGDHRNRRKPAIWIAHTSVGITFENLFTEYPAVGIRLGVEPIPLDAPPDAEEKAGRHGDASLCYFRNVQININNNEPENRGAGPVVDIGFAFWVWFDRCVFHGYPQAARRKVSSALMPGQKAEQQEEFIIDHDQRAVILVKPDLAHPASSTGKIYIDDCIFGGGHFKYYVGRGGWEFSIRNCTFESAFVALPPLVQVIGANQFGTGYIENVNKADAPGNQPDVEISPGTAPAESIVCVGVGKVTGPATVLNRYPSNWQDQRETPTAQRQVGFWQGRLAAQHDSARRTFGPVAARFRNLAEQDAARWSKSSADITLGIAAPDGNQTAARISTTVNERRMQNMATIAVKPPSSTDNALPLSVGDYVMAGVWVRAVSEAGFLNEAAIITFGTKGFQMDSGNNYSYLRAPLAGDGEWEWLHVMHRLTQVPAQGHDYLFFHVNCDQTHTVEVFAPLLIIMRGMEVSRNEALELAQHLSSWPNGFPAGTVALLRNQDFALQGHLITRGGQLTVAPVVSAGSKAQASVIGNDVAGTITLRAGTQARVGALVEVIFSRPYGIIPHVLLTPINALTGANAPGFYATATATGFAVNAANAPRDDSTYQWNYLIVQ
jgi:hypothetical protein